MHPLTLLISHYGYYFKTKFTSLACWWERLRTSQGWLLRKAGGPCPCEPLPLPNPQSPDSNHPSPLTTHRGRFSVRPNTESEAPWRLGLCIKGAEGPAIPFSSLLPFPSIFLLSFLSLAPQNPVFWGEGAFPDRVSLKSSHRNLIPNPKLASDFQGCTVNFISVPEVLGLQYAPPHLVLCGAEDRTEGPVCLRQVFYQLSHTVSPKLLYKIPE